MAYAITVGSLRNSLFSGLFNSTTVVYRERQVFCHCGRVLLGTSPSNPMINASSSCLCMSLYSTVCVSGSDRWLACPAVYDTSCIPLGPLSDHTYTHTWVEQYISVTAVITGLSHRHNLRQLWRDNSQLPLSPVCTSVCMQRHCWGKCVTWTMWSLWILFYIYKLDALLFYYTVWNMSSITALYWKNMPTDY